MLTLTILLAILQIFGTLALGWMARRLGYIREEELKRWSTFVVDCMLPFLAFYVILTGFRTERAAEALWLPAIGLGQMVLGMVLGFGFRWFVANRDPKVRSTFHHFCAINNYGFLPIIIVQNLTAQGVWDDSGLADLFFLNLGSTVGYFTFGIALLGASDLRMAFKRIFSPNILALFVAALLVATGWDRWVPRLLINISREVGNAAVPLMLLLVGATLYPLPKVTFVRDVAYLSVVRLVVLPLITIGILALLPLDAQVYRISIIVALMPGPLTSTILAQRYGGSPQFAAQAALVTTLISVLTVPLAIGLFWR